jgi:type VI protein secretion system component Hcp
MIYYTLVFPDPPLLASQPDFELPIRSFSDDNRGTRGAPTQPHPTEFFFTMEGGGAAAQAIATAAANGKMFNKVVLNCFDDSYSKTKPYLRVTMTFGIIANYSHSGESADGKVLDNFTINVQSSKFEYKPDESTGG